MHVENVLEIKIRYMIVQSKGVCNSFKLYIRVNSRKLDELF